MKSNYTIDLLFLIFSISIYSCSSGDDIDETSSTEISSTETSSTETSSTETLSNTTLIYPEKITAFTAEEIGEIIDFGYNKMKNPEAKVLAVLWETGAFISEGGFDNRPYNKHEVVISQEIIEEILSKTSSWIDSAFNDFVVPDDFPKEQRRNSFIKNLSRRWCRCINPS
jgi:hypothetical protein